ncbi:DUF11 domain-containing protein [Aeoliella sp. ICT_H6.2]|uniref:DUF11 domain-containing protein n=1 Tax=Aeoliella straminimaris TaxID=2954799 RepID=A0A9X2JIB1_9BACT|nr:DUF11 domain-containing protein [Aeoliella straminimaris]MCO6046377.1 DUF11 domain-containing protein [Aeoliella straminimaris]
MASLCDPCRTSEGEEALTSSEANAQTTIVAVPALRVSVVDQQDPIRGGDQVVYKIVVFNQGKAPDKNVQVSAELPGNLEFQQASGETSASADGRQVSFEAVEQVMPGEKLEWKLIAAAEGSGEALIKVNVSSDSLEGTVQSQEPTYLLGESSNGSSGN